MNDPSPTESPTPTIVCPLCPLMCDDVTISNGRKLNASNCSIVDRFQVGHARGEFKSSLIRRPVRVVTTGTDLVTSRKLATWQADGTIELTIETDRSIAAMLETISRDGIVSATLAEVRSRCDSIALFGAVESAFPRINEKLDLGRFEDETIKRWPSVGAEELAEQFVDLAAASPEPLNQSTYAAVVVGPGAFLAGEEEITSGMITRWVRKRNETVRAVCVTLDWAATLRSVCLWTNNQVPGDVSVSQYDVRLGSPLNGQSRPARIQIGGTDPGSKLASTFTPASVAGIHHRSMMVRGDGSISLPLLGSVVSDLETPLEILTSLMESDDHTA